MLNVLARLFLPDAAYRDEEARRLAVRLIAFSLAMLFWVPVFTGIYIVLASPISATIVGLAGPIVVGNLALFRFTNRYTLCANILTTTAWLVYTLIACFEGGNGSISTWWYATIPVLAITFCGLRVGFVWLGICVASIGGFYVAASVHVPFPKELTVHGYEFMEFSSLLGLTMCLHALTWVFFRMESRSRELLSTAVVEAQLADRVKSEFLANMSHEIRTPMTAVLGYTDLILDNNLQGESVTEACATIKRNGEHLVRVINDILDLSRIEAGRMEVHLSPCDVRQLINDVTQLLRPRVVDKQVALLATYEEPAPAWIRTDGTRLRQIVLNLLGNAIKFTEKGEVRLHFRWSDVGGGQLFGEIRDTGIGISAEQMPHLFQAFSQGDASMTRRFGGTGLGLAISRSLAVLLGGDVRVVSEVGQGSTFTFTIAAPSCDAPACEVPGANLNHRAESLAGLRILLADDSTDNQRLIEHILTRVQCQVDVVGDGQSAFDRALAAQERYEPYDIVLMDMQMPGIDGYTATRMLRRCGYRRPVIALTAHSMEADRQKCLDAGCDDYDTKPIERQRLFTVIARNVPKVVESV